MNTADGGDGGGAPRGSRGSRDELDVASAAAAQPSAQHEPLADGISAVPEKRRRAIRAALQIREYEIQIRQIADQTVLTEWKWNSRFQKNGPGKDPRNCKLRFEHLNGGTQYEARVRARTLKGWSPLSAPSLAARTLPGV